MIILSLKLLLLVIAANSAPVIACKLLAKRCSATVDGGLLLADGHPLFGASKTWRGLISALLLTGFVAFLVELPLLFGLLFAVVAMAGDLLSSFIKRRLGRAVSTRAMGLDQIPESLLPLLLGSGMLGYHWSQALAIALAFTVIELSVSPLLFRLGLRKRPY
ncbi:MAG: CDP-archaeol synthase [Pseudomonadales bacterium]